jgi:CelD/BcsL family acetyltransferase involved in cellulose biosynthesis
MAEALRVERITDEPAFAALASEWNDVLARSEADTVFLTWEWLDSWWRILGRGLRLNVLAVREGRRLVGLAPLTARAWEPRRLRLYPHLMFLGAPLVAGNVGSDYLDLIVDRDSPSAATMLAEAIRREGRVVELAQVRGEGATADGMAQHLAAGGWRHRRVSGDVCPAIELGGRSWAEYLAGLGSEHRYAVQRKLRKIEREHDVRFERAATETERAEALRWLIDLHDRRFREKGEASTFHTPTLRAFHEEFTRRALVRGWLRLYLLRLDGRPAAAFYALRYGDTFSFFQSGFDPDYGRLSVGLVAMALSIQAAIEEGARRYDLLHGSEEYKFHWANVTRPLVRQVFFPPRLPGAMARGLTGLYDLLRPMARRVLQSS